MKYELVDIWRARSWLFPINLLLNIELFNEIGHPNSRNACQFRQYFYWEKQRKESSHFSYHNCNESFRNSVLFNWHPPCLKKKGKINKENYRLISILLTLSKICDGCMANQTNSYNYLKEYRCPNIEAIHEEILEIHNNDSF